MSGITISPGHVSKLVIGLVIAIVIDKHDLDDEQDYERDYDSFPPARMTIPRTHGFGGEVQISTTRVSLPVFSMPCTHQGGR